MKVLSGHQHWIWAVRYNRYHDQLVVTASSDHSVTLWNVESISSARDSEEEEATNKKSSVFVGPARDSIQQATLLSHTSTNARNYSYLFHV